MKKREFLIRYFFYLALACCIFYKGEYIGQWTYYISNFFIKYVLLFVFAIVFFILLGISLFVKIENKIYVIRKICKVYLPIVLLPFIYLLVCVVFTPSIVVETSFLIYYLLTVTTILLILDILLNIEYIYYEQYFYYVINILPCLLFRFNRNIDFESDSPIQTSQYDILDRTDFINILKRKVMNIDKEKGFAFLLSGGWGEGKTSCINLLKEKLKKENLFEFIDINPWFNDTKEKLLNAILGEINTFAKSFYPYKSFESDFDDIIKLANIKLTNHVEIALQNILDNFTKDNNIQHKIGTIGNILKNEYSKRIIIVLDDIDRLSKEHILYILQVVQMFKQYTNIIFVLSVDYNKIENILCEISDPCVKNNDTNNNDIGIKKALYYKNYLEKIASVIIPLPKIDDDEIKEILFERINNILKEEQMPTMDRDEFFFHISNLRFKTIRDIKRFCNTFLISYAQVKNEVNVFNYINISILFVFYPELYNEAWNNQDRWFRIQINLQNKNQISILQKYFNGIIEKYDAENIEIIKELMMIISPVYEKIPDKNVAFALQPNKGERSYFLDERYLQYYFTHNFSKNRIPDKILGKRLQSWFNEKDEIIREKSILNFMQEYSSKISDLFRYLNLYYDDKYADLFKQIILIFSKNSFDLSNVFSESVKYIHRIMLKLKTDIINFLVEIIKNASSVSFSIEIYHDVDLEVDNNYKWVVYNSYRDINNILDEKISKDLENTLGSFKYERYNRYLYLWLQNYYVTKTSEIENVIDLQIKDYILVREKVKKVLPFIRKNIEYFMIFVGQSLERSIKDYNNDKTFEHIYLKNFMYHIDIWGKDNLSKLLSTFINNSKGLDYYNRVIKLSELYRVILNDQQIKNVIQEHERIFINKIALYDLTKNINVNNLIRGENIDGVIFDFSYIYNDIKYLIQVKHTLKIDISFIKKLLNIISRQEKQILCLCFIVDSEEEKLKLEEELNKFFISLDKKDIFMFKIETKKILLEKY